MSRQRLDEILLQEGLVSEEQIEAALKQQRDTGGRFGSHLLNSGALDETKLVKALARQMGCEGVVISGLVVPKSILESIPAQVAISRRVLPFSFDADENLLKLACPDPNDAELHKELRSIQSGRNIKLYVAVELALSTAIARFYLGQQIPEGEKYIRDTVNTGATMPIQIIQRNVRGEILLVSDDPDSSNQMRFLLENDRYGVTLCESADDAINMVGDKQFHTVLIKDSVSGDYLDLIDRLRKISPSTQVRYFEDSASLLLNLNALQNELDLMAKSLDMMTSLLSVRDGLASNHSGHVGQYVSKLCQRLGLPEKDRLMITAAGYLHEFARFYYGAEGKHDSREVIKLTAKLLESLNYSPVVTQMLRAMYRDLRGRFTKRLPIEKLGGNILTIVDLFCESIDVNERIPIDKFDTLVQKVEELVGKLFMREVVDAFVALINEEILERGRDGGAMQVMIFCDDLEAAHPVMFRLNNDGFRTVAHSNEEKFVQLYKRSEPDMLVVMVPQEGDNAGKLLDRMMDGGVRISAVPTVVLADFSSTSRLTELFDRGVEDVIALNDNLDFLSTKLQRIRTRLKADRQMSQSSKVSNSPTQGRLSDMNLIDLLQAMGPSRKTVRITMTCEEDDTYPLVMFLKHGHMTFAQLGDKLGADAIYEAIAWEEGSWQIEHVNPDSLPEGNNEMPNESILMEACRLLDESRRIEQQQAGDTQ